MRNHNRPVGVTTSHTVLFADWADALLRHARGTLGRVEATLVAAEAKLVEVRRHVADRRAAEPLRQLLDATS